MKDVDPWRGRDTSRPPTRRWSGLWGRLRDDGSYGLEADDLACYYKSPYLFSLSGRPREASRLLTFIRRTFMRADHDFTTAPGHKSDRRASPRTSSAVPGTEPPITE
jgi:hypothetical protein